MDGSTEPLVPRDPETGPENVRAVPENAHGLPDVERDLPESAPRVQESATDRFEHALLEAPSLTYTLVLYVAGTAPRSLRAINAIRELCHEHLVGCHDLQVVDIYQQPALAEEAGILAVPALIKTDPPPPKVFIGDMSNLRDVIISLGLSRLPTRGDEG